MAGLTDSGSHNTDVSIGMNSIDWLQVVLEPFGAKCNVHSRDYSGFPVSKHRLKSSSP